MLSKKLFYLLILLLPIQLGRHFWPDFSFVLGIRMDYLAPTIYLTDVLVLGILAIWTIETILKLKTKNLKIKNLKILVISSLLLVVNIVFAQNVFLAFFKSLKIIELGFLAFYIAHEKPSLKITVYCLLLAVCYSCLIAWGQFIKQSSLGGAFWFLGERTFDLSTPGIARADIFGKLILRPYATFPHPNVLAGFLAAILPFILFFPKLNSQKNLISGVFYYPLIFFILTTIFITFSRTVWITTFLILLVSIFCLAKRKKTAFIFFGIGFLSFVFLVPVFFARINSAFTTDRETIVIREKLINISLAMWKKHPLTGVGLNNFIPQISSFSRVNSYQELQPVHNIFLLVLAETGIIGLLLFVWLMIKAIKTKFSYLFIVHYSSFIILFLSLFDHYFFTLQQTQLLFAVIVGLIFALKKGTIKITKNDKIVA